MSGLVVNFQSSLPLDAQLLISHRARATSTRTDYLPNACLSPSSLYSDVDGDHTRSVEHTNLRAVSEPGLVLTALLKRYPRSLRTAQVENPALLIDDSLSLINRTGAYFIAKDLVEHFGQRATVRRWRLIGQAKPEGLGRKVLARLMLMEMNWLRSQTWLRWPEPVMCKRLFLDPLYVLRSRLAAADVVLCHDIGPVTHPDLYDRGTVELYADAYKKIVAAKPGMVFVSNTSRRAFETAFGTDFRFLHAIPLYVRPATVDTRPEPVPGIRKPFFLSVGALERRKNHTTTLEAFAESGLAKEGVSLVICGSRGDATKEIEERVARTPGAVLPGYVTDAQLSWLYREAEAFVLPSLFEGFGMPALEAAAHGLIPIISSDSALNEAVGSLGLAIEPRDVRQLSRAFVKLAKLGEEELSAWRTSLLAHADKSTRNHFLAQWAETLFAREELVVAKREPYPSPSSQTPRSA